MAIVTRYTEKHADDYSEDSRSSTDNKTKGSVSRSRMLILLSLLLFAGALCVIGICSCLRASTITSPTTDDSRKRVGGGSSGQKFNPNNPNGDHYYNDNTNNGSSSGNTNSRNSYLPSSLDFTNTNNTNCLWTSCIVIPLAILIFALVAYLLSCLFDSCFEWWSGLCEGGDEEVDEEVAEETQQIVEQETDPEANELVEEEQPMDWNWTLIGYFAYYAVLFIALIVVYKRYF